MRKPNKILSGLIAFALFFNTAIPSASACWWKGLMLAFGSPEMIGIPQDANNSGLPNQETFGEPVYVHNGDFVYEFKDLFIPSRGMPLEIKHTYKSHSIYNNRFGCGWDLNYNQRIIALSNSDAYYFDGTNMRWRFSYLDGTNYNSPPGTYDKLRQNADGTWVLTKKHGDKYYFNQNGLLAKIEDRNLNAITFIYNTTGKLPIIQIPFYARTLINPLPRVTAFDYQLVKIKDTVGREIGLSYDANGKLTSITDFTGRTISYDYDASGDLLSITRPATADFPSGTTTHFSYSNHKLTTITDAKGQNYLTNFYNGQGMVDAQEYGGNKVYLTYNTLIKKTEVKDGKGFRTIYTFNSSGNPLKKEQFTSGLRTGVPFSYITTYTYNAHMERTKIVYPKGNSVEYDYNNMGNLLEIRRKAKTGSGEPDIVSSFTYEPHFNLIKTSTDSKGNSITYYYDYEEETLGDLNGDGATNQDKGNLVKISYPAVAGQTPETKFTHNAYGQVLSVTDPNGNVIKYEYDATTGYLLKTTRAQGTLNLTTEMTYDAVGNVKTLKDPKSNAASFNYDSHNNLIKTTSPAPFNYITKNLYDANDNLIQVDRETKDAANPWQTTYYTYDSLDKLITITDELNNTAVFGYDANGNKNLVQDAELNSTQYEYDERNLLWKVTDAQGNVTEYAYDENENLKEIKDAKGNKTTYAYDDFDRLISTTYADSSKEEYTYDANSNLASKKDPKGQTIYYDYDALNRLLEKGLLPKGTAPNSVVSYIYDQASRLIDITSATGTIHYDYDAANRITQVSTQGLTPQGTVPVSYEYDPSSNRSKLIYPDSSFITYEYDELNRLTAIKNQSGQAIVSYTYDALSRRTNGALANGLETVYTYDYSNRLLQLDNRQSAIPTNKISQFSYTYDKVGNRKNMVTQTGTHNYTYDIIYQLKNADYPNGYPFSDTAFTYDAVENRITQETTSYTANNLNQYTSVGTTSYSYDANGNLISDGSNTYVYDHENRLIEGAVPARGLSLTYTYDALGRRIAKDITSPEGQQVTKYVYDGDQIIAEYDGSDTLISKFIYGAGIDEVVKGLTPQGTAPEWYYHYDGLGSVTNLTDSSGATLESYSYDAFGNPDTTSSLGNTRMFTGREYDSETGLYYYRARYYSPQLGRFLQRDPVGYTAGVNLYSYCDNNPINWLDPFGLDKEKSWWDRFWDAFWLNIYLNPPTIGISYTIFGQTTVLDTSGASINISPTTLFGVSIDVQSWNPQSNFQAGVGLGRHLGVGTYPLEKGIKPWAVNIGVSKALPVTTSFKIIGTDWKTGDTSGLITGIKGKREELK